MSTTNDRGVLQHMMSRAARTRDPSTAVYLCSLQAICYPLTQDVSRSFTYDRRTGACILEAVHGSLSFISQTPLLLHSLFPLQFLSIALVSLLTSLIYTFSGFSCTAASLGVQTGNPQLPTATQEAYPNDKAHQKAPKITDLVAHVLTLADQHLIQHDLDH